MRKFIGAASRRTAGMAAGVILTGGLVGGVLLAPGTAYAAGTTPSSTTVSATAQGSTIDVTVSVTPTGATGAVSVSDGAGGGCNTSVGGMGGFGFGQGSGSCQIRDVPSGTYTVTATYQGSATYAESSGSTSVNVAGNPTTPMPTPTPSGNAPAWNADSPPTSVNGQSYSYQFQASNSPSFELVGAPSWLSIGPDGMVSGTIPGGTSSFSYSVYAWNSWGHVTAGPFNVSCGHNYQNYGYVDIHTHLYCSRYVFTGQRGYCTLTVTNDGYSFAPDVTAQITLPWPLKAGYSGYYFGYRISGSTVTEDLGTLYPGETRELSVSFTALGGFNIWGRHPGRQFTVRVVGSASSYGNYGNYWFYGQQQSYSVAYVTIIPRGFWW